MATTDYLPVATGAGANVDTQAQFSGSGYQQNGFVVGTAQPSQANKIWRQSSMIAAAVAKSISDLLNIDVLDDGNLPNLVANFKAMLKSGLGFTPVQQGTGINQQPNIVKIGWSAAGRLRLTVDTTDEGFFALASDLDPVSAAAAAAQTTANTGVANAATAQASANAAQATANAALADATAPRTVSVSDQTGNRALNAILQNLSGGIMFVSGAATTNPGSSVGALKGMIGPANPPTMKAWGNESTASVSGADAGFFFVVPNGWFYEVTGSGDIAGVSSWIETVMD